VNRFRYGEDEPIQQGRELVVIELLAIGEAIRRKTGDALDQTEPRQAGRREPRKRSLSTLVAFVRAVAVTRRDRDSRRRPCSEPVAR